MLKSNIAMASTNSLYRVGYGEIQGMEKEQNRLSDIGNRLSPLILLVYTNFFIQSERKRKF